MGANNMFIDGVVIGAAVGEFVASILLRDWAQAVIWAILGVYALFNMLDRRLVGSKYDY